MELLDPTDAPTPAQFRKRPVVITAFQWQGDFDALDAWLNALGYSEDGDDGQDGDPGGMREDHNTAGETLLVIPTLEGEMTAKPGDWIIRGVKGEFYPCKPDIFAATYERADAAASPFPIQAHAVGCDHALSIPVDRCSCNGRDFIPTQAIDAQITRVLTTDAVLHPSPTEADLAQFADAAASSAPSQEEWTPTPEHINALPLPIRSYIYQLETECDPSGSLRELVIARDTIRAFEVLAAGARTPQQDKLEYLERLGQPICCVEGGGCGEKIHDPSAVYRCADCTQPFHRKCLRNHFVVQPRGELHPVAFAAGARAPAVDVEPLTKGEIDSIIAALTESEMLNSAQIAVVARKLAAGACAVPSAKCADCGDLLNEGEAKCFTVCDACWEKVYPRRAVPETHKDDK